MAGSGKSALTAAYLGFLRKHDQDALVVNLDPGATVLPYNPDIDSRNYVDVEKLMLDYKLGPNGALIMASDLLADRLEEIRGEIEDAAPDLVLVDTAGQIELFAFREGGRFIASHLSDDAKALVFLMDAPFTRRPLNFVTNVYLAAAIQSRLGQPQIYALSKSDLVDQSELEQIIDWSTEPESFELALHNMDEQNLALVSRELSRAVTSAGFLAEPIPVSAENATGLVELNAAVTRILSGGEERRE